MRSPSEKQFPIIFRCGETVTLNADGVTVTTKAPVRFPMLVFDGQEETKVALDGNALRLKSAGRGIQVLLTESATWQRTGKRLKHRNGLVEEAFADATGYRISVLKGEP